MNSLKQKQKEVFLGKSMLNNRYILGKKIGKGGLSNVYKATDIYAKYFKDSRELVIKLPSKKLSTKNDIAAFVYSEYFILSMMRNDYVVKVLDFGIDEDSELTYLVMQKLKGDLLIDIPLYNINKEIKNNIAFSLYNSIIYIHSLGIIHADINPTNIMVSSNGFAQLFDFGISQNIKNNKTFHLDYKKMNAYNPRYTAPEIFDGKTPSVKTDLFSLACVLFELYTNELPFKSSSLELKEKGIESKLLHKIPYLQRSWIVNMLSYEPENRNKNIPFCIRFKIFSLKCKKMCKNNIY